MPVIAGLLALLPQRAPGGDGQALSVPLTGNGTIPVWYVAGPFDQPITGFGTPVDADSIGEATVRPIEGKAESSAVCADGVARWRGQSVDARGYLDLAGSIGWSLPGATPEKIWTAKAGYAFVQIDAPTERTVLLLAGSNSSLRVYLNGLRVHVHADPRGAAPDQDTIRMALRRGRNDLLLKVGNTSENYSLAFFGGTPWGWGAYARIVEPGGGAPSDLRAVLQGSLEHPGVTLVSTFFFKDTSGVLLQRFDCIIDSPWPESRRGAVRLETGGKAERWDVPDLRFGRNRIELYRPAVQADQPVRCVVTAGTDTFSRADTLRAQPHYELHLMFLTHTDIGYTHTQPVVKELHLRTLDHAVAMCREHPDFRWTIETVWQLQEYERARPRAAVEEVMRLIREGRMAVSPFLTNPFTGWVSEEEMIRSLAKAGEYRADHHITYDGAVYNDVPGLAWFMPRVLRDAGVSLIACGLNEFFEGYALQRALPKAFVWEGGDRSRVIVYRCETYGEGMAYGLERGGLAVEQRMWERLQKLRLRGEDRHMILLDAAWMDNGDVAAGQFQTARKWNAAHAYPRFVFTTIGAFARDFSRRYGKTLPVLRGDFTSAWDIQNQGEPARTLRERWAQQQVLAAEGLDVIQSLRTPGQPPLRALTRGVYESLLQFSGHGSGLEYGYGTRSENRIATEYREQDVRSAMLGTEELLERSRNRLVRPEEEFAEEGVIVWNPLSWPCAPPLDIELKDSSDIQYDVADMLTRAAVPSYRSGYHLYVIAPSLPPLGFRKFSMRPSGNPSAEKERSDLNVWPDSVANQFFCIAVDRSTGRVSGIRDRTTGRELIESRPGFAEPVVRRGYGSTTYVPVSVGGAEIRIVDERPARVLIRVTRPGQLFEKTEYVLWNGVNRVDVSFQLRLDRLSPPAEVENYSIGFPFALRSPEARFDVLGGFLTAGRDRLPGALKDGFAIRRSVGLSDGTFSVAWSAADSRVVFWQGDSAGRPPCLLANVVNNFPLVWNRNEENAGLWTYRFSFTMYRGGFDPERTSRLGWEAMTAFPAAHTLLRPAPADTSFLSVEGRNVLLGALKASDRGGGAVLRLMNASPDSSATATIASPLLSSMTAYESNVFEDLLRPIPRKKDAWSIPLGPSEVRTIFFAPATVR